MAKTNEYIEEAYDTLLELSADEKERLAYEARQKAIWDYNSYMGSARREGAREKTISFIKNLLKKGMSDEEICVLAECEQTLIDEVKKGL